MSTAAVLLAAGGGARYTASGGDGHKLLAELRGGTVVGWAIDQAVEAGLDALYVVVGAVEVPVPEGVRLVPNPRWDKGMATSLQAGLRAAGHDGHDAAVVGLGDQPLVRAEAWRRVAATASPVAVARYQAGRGHPVRLAASVWSLLPVAGDQGARELMAEHPGWVTEVPCPGSPIDVDTQEDLQRWS